MPIFAAIPTIPAQETDSRIRYNLLAGIGVVKPLPAAETQGAGLAGGPLNGVIRTGTRNV
jgi:hypothetical protein